MNAMTIFLLTLAAMFTASTYGDSILFSALVGMGVTALGTVVVLKAKYGRQTLATSRRRR